MPNWLLMENGVLLNLDLITDIRPEEHEQKASAWAAGVVVHADSRVLWKYYQSVVGKLALPGSAEATNV